MRRRMKWGGNLERRVYNYNIAELNDEEFEKGNLFLDSAINSISIQEMFKSSAL